MVHNISHPTNYTFKWIGPSVTKETRLAHKFRTSSRSLQTGNFVLSSLVLGSFMLEEW